MRIAYLTSCSPLPPTSGHSLRVYANWRALAQVGEVELFAFGTRPPAASRPELRARGIVPLPSRVEGRAAGLARHLRSLATGRSMLYAKAVSPRRIERLHRHLAARRTDLLVIGDTWLADLLPALRTAATHTVVDTHNVESRLYARICAEQPWPRKAKFLAFRRNVAVLERQLAAADAVWAVSEADAAVYRGDHGLRHVAVLPNAIDVDAYGRETAQAEPRTIVFTGSFGYWPNEAAALHLVGLSHRLAQAGIAHRMLLVGRDATPAMHRAAQGLGSVVITGPVPDIRPFIAGAGIVAAPLTSGSGTKYKILEALALGRLVVTTPVGSEGLDIVDGVHACVAPDLPAFDAVIAERLRTPGDAQAIGREGRRWVAERCSIDALAAAMRRAVRELGLGAAPRAEMA